MKKNMNRFDINSMTRLYHITNIEVVADGALKQLDKFAESNPDKKEIIEQKKEQVLAMKEAQVYISKLYSALETEKQSVLHLKIENQKLHEMIGLLKKKIDELDLKFERMIEFEK